MPDINLTLTCADYARVMPLATGAVRPNGIDLTLVLGERTWKSRAEMLRRALDDPSVQGGEQSMAGHLLRIDAGDRSHVALPVFPLRNFTARDLYVRKGGPISKPAELAGCRIGMYGWANSGSVWYRHFLTYLGIDIHALHWCVGPVDEPRPSSVRIDLPPGVTATPDGRSLSDMLIAGDLDAIYSPPRPARFDGATGPIVRLFPEFRSVEQAYFRSTGAFPPQHLIVLRRAVWEANRWIARSLTDAFAACNDAFTEAQRSFPYASPWMEAELQDTAAVMGEDFHPYGLDRNRGDMELFCETAYTAGLTKKRVSVDDYFAEFLAS